MDHSGKRVMTFLGLWFSEKNFWVSMEYAYSVLLRACALILDSNQNGSVLALSFFTSRNELPFAFEKADNGPLPKAK